MEEVTMENQMEKSKTRIVIPSEAEEFSHSFPFVFGKPVVLRFSLLFHENCEQIPRLRSE
jgi:archaeosine-15-forming tRNA-guanine transglycosylase